MYGFMQTAKMYALKLKVIYCFMQLGEIHVKCWD
jgi:hypothetical protein